MQDKDIKRIDALRNSAASMRVGDESEGAISDILFIEKSKYTIKEKAIYKIFLADDVDPERKNISIPNSHQLIINYGSTFSAVFKILLTGKELFHKDRIRDGIDVGKLLSKCLDITINAVELRKISDELTSLIKEKKEKSTKIAEGSLSMPSIPQIEGKIKSFIQNIDHAFIKLFEICCIFYDETALRKAGRWHHGLREYLRSNSPQDHQFIDFSGKLAETGKFIRDIRACVEHQKEDQKIILNDYALTASGNIREPTIEVVHKESAIKPTDICDVINGLAESLEAFSELLFAFLAARNLKEPRIIPIYVDQIPENQRRNGVRYGYVMLFGDHPQRMS